MLQDTLQHAEVPPMPDTAPLFEADSTARAVQPVRAFKAVKDTVKPDPARMMPMPPAQKLTCMPQWLEEDCWDGGLIRIERTELLQRLDSLSGRPQQTAVSLPSGKAGDPVPYQFKNDDIVTSLFLLSFFLVVWVIAGSRHFLQGQVKDFFYQRDRRDNLFSERTQNELRGQIFLIFQTCFVLGLLFFDYTQEKQVEVFNQVSPYRILGMSVGLTVLYYLIKIGLYSFVNNVFFTRRQVRDWSEVHLLCTLGLGLALLPVVLLVVYFDLDFVRLSLLFICILTTSKLLLCYKCYRIFFSYPLGWVHLFLYFCTLEIVPLLVLFRALHYANNFLLTIN